MFERKLRLIKICLINHCELDNDHNLSVISRWLITLKAVLSIIFDSKIDSERIEHHLPLFVDFISVAIIDFTRCEGDATDISVLRVKKKGFGYYIEKKCEEFENAVISRYYIQRIERGENVDDFNPKEIKELNKKKLIYKKE